MSIKQVNINNLLELSSKLRSVIVNRNLVKSLFDQAETEWDKAFSESTQEHFIKGVANANTKTDAVRNYVGRLVRLHLNSLGGGAWSKNSIQEDHVFATLVTNKLTTNIYEDNVNLFTDACVHLLGFDKEVVNYSITEDSKEAAFYLTKYLICHLDLIARDFSNTDENQDTFDQRIKDEFFGEIQTIQELIESEGFDNEFFFNLNSKLINSEEVEVSVPEGDLLDALLKHF